MGKRKRMPVSVSSAVIIPDSQGKILLLQQAAKEKGGKWGLPAGGMEPNEDPKKTAIREAFEEIQVVVKLLNLVGIYTLGRRNNTGLGFVFSGKIVDGEIIPNGEEISSFKFFTPEEIKTLIINNQLYKPEYTIRGIRDWKNGAAYSLEAVSSMQQKVGN